MRRSCEETLRVLRAAKDSLLTIVEVFIHDPLYRWALTPAGAAARQQPGDGSQGVRALRTPCVPALCQSARYMTKHQQNTSVAARAAHRAQFFHASFSTS